MNRSATTRLSCMLLRTLQALALAASAVGGWALHPPLPVEAAGTIEGTVFLDYNQDGEYDTAAPAGESTDVGVGGVTVSAFDASGALQGTATTGSNGVYSLSASGTGPYRLEFTVPAGYQPSGSGPNNRTTVQFVADGDSSGNDLALTIPEQYCQNNPLQCTSRYVNGTGTPGSQTGNTGALVSFPETSSGTTTAPITATTMSAIGATWGLAWQRSSNSLFAGTIAKRHTGFGPLGSGGIYRIVLNPATGALLSVTPFVDLDALIPGANSTGVISPRDLASTYGTPSYDTDAFGKIGKVGLGDVELSTDGSILYVMNLADRTLYALNIGTNPIAPTTATGYPVSLPAGATACSAATDVVPWAIEVNNNQVYVGAVCTAETSQSRADLRAYVLRLNGSTFDLVSEFALNYPRGCSTNQSSTCYGAEWQPWSSQVRTVCTDAGSCSTLAYGKQIIYAQPILSDIEFDNDGSMVLGFIDRSGHQWGNANYYPGGPGNVTLNFINPATGAISNTQTLSNTAGAEGVSAGDLLRLCAVSGGWQLENNADCPGGGPATNGAGQTPSQGPGTGEYYWQDMYTLSGDRDIGSHQEITLGGLAMIPGRSEVSATVFDPDSAFRAGGVGWFNNGTGNRVRSYQVFGLDSAGSFGKAGGLGDIESLCANAPIEIGNRIWVDADGDGVQDPGEAPIGGLTVQLYDNTGTLVGTTTTNGSGEWYFGGVNNSNMTGGLPLQTSATYQVRVPLAQSAITTNDYSLTGPNQGGNDSIDSDAIAEGGNAVITVRTGSAGQNNHTYDIGFFNSVALGNLVWLDLNNNGLADPGEPGLDGVTVRLLDASGTTVITSTTTSNGGLYLFNDLAPATYVVEIVPPAGTSSSTGTPGSATGPYEGNPAGGQPPDPDNDVNNDDNGNHTAGPGSPIRSQPVILTSNGEPVTDGDGDDDTNLTVDFGLVGTLSLGDTVWFDVNNNGLIDAGEGGINGVPVRLYDSSGNLIASTVTAGGGLYLFPNLPAGDYYVEITPPAGYCSSTGAPGLAGSAGGPYEGAATPDPDNNANGDDNGSSTGPCGSPIRSGVITLAPNDEPDNDGDTDRNTNLTVDFGLYQPVSLGNLVWLDADNSGSVNGSEAGIDGVPVRLYDSAGNLISTTTTAGGGLYLFSNLAPGDYYVEITPPAGYCSSTGQWGSATGPNEGPLTPDPDNDVNNDDNGNSTGPCGSPIRSGVITLTSGGEPDNDGDTDRNSNLTVDFGLFQPAALGNLVWNDLDSNGQQDPGENGVAGVIVELRDGSGTLIITTTTAADGTYLFPNLPPGTYSVGFTNIPPGSSFTTPNTGGDASDSDADPVTGRTGQYTLVAGQTDLTVDAGLVGVPTAVTLIAFEVSAPEGGRVQVRWETAEEIDTVAFRLYRSPTERFADAVRVHETAATGGGSTYTFVDTVVGDGPYTYWLFSVNSQGVEQAAWSPETALALRQRIFIPSVRK